MIRIVVADDHSVIRRGLKQILLAEGDFEVVGEAASVPELVDLLGQKDADALVLDISMPGGGGLDAIKQLKKMHAQLPILVLSVHPENQYAVRAIRSGAMGYLSKECAPEELVGALRQVVAGTRYITPSVGELMAHALVVPSAEQVPHASLSDREFQVMLMLARGQGLTDIAHNFNLSVKTIGTYRDRLLRKMGMKTNADIIQYVVRNNLLESN